MTPPTDAGRFEAMVRPHLESMFRLAYRLTGNRTNAEDLVQDVLVKVYPRLTEMTRIGNLGAWLARVLYNQFIDDKRSATRSPIYLAIDNTTDESDVLDSLAADDTRPTQDPAQNMEQDRQQQRIHDAMMKLEEGHRTILLMHDVEGYTFAELGEILDCPVGTLKSRLHRARAALRDRLNTSALPGSTSRVAPARQTRNKNT